MYKYEKKRKLKGQSRNNFIGQESMLIEIAYSYTTMCFPGALNLLWFAL